MTTAKDIMAPAVISVSPDTSLDEAMEILVANGLSGLPVINADGRLEGIISEADRLTTLLESGRVDHLRVSDCMTRGVITVGEDVTLVQIADLLTRVGIRRVPVVHNGSVVGLISRSDLIRALHANGAEG